MKIKLSMSRLSCLLCLFFPSAVQASFWSTLVSSVLIVSVPFANSVPSDTCPEGSKICFQSNPELRSAVKDYIANGERSDAAQTYGYPIGTWCVKDVTDMSGMFQGAISFNEDISGWDVSSVTDMSRMFNWAKAFNQDISGWDVSQVTNMNCMFCSASAFNQDLSPWNVSSVTDMSQMFFGASAFNQDLSPWNVSSVTDMHDMFFGASAFNQDLSPWNVSSVTDMHDMFWLAMSLNQDLCAWRDKIQGNTNVGGMFLYSGCPYKEDPDLSNATSGPFCAKCTDFTSGIQNIIKWICDHINFCYGWLRG